MTTSASLSNDDNIIAEVIEGENEESEADQDDEESTPPTRQSTNEFEDALETLQDLSMFSTRGDKIRFFQKEITEEKSSSKPPVSIFTVFIKLFENSNSL